MPPIFQPAAWLFLGAGAIMLLVALRYQWRVWWPFPGGLVMIGQEGPLTRWIDYLRRRRPRRARRAEDLAQAQARRRRRQAIDRVRQAITLARTARALAILATLLALWSALQLPTDVTTATLWSWEPVSDLPLHGTLRVALTYRVDDLGRWLAQITLAVSLLAFVARGSHRARDYAWGLMALGAFVQMVFCLDLIAFLASWIILDVALFAVLAGSVRAKDAQVLIVSVAASMAVTLALLWAILMVGPVEGTWLFTRASPILLEDRVLGMFLLAAVFRLALYPFHLRFRLAAKEPSPLATIGHLLPLMAGFYLLARLYALASGEIPGLGGVQTLGVLSLVAGAVLVWRSREPKTQLSYAFLSQAGGLVMVLTLGSLEAITATLVGLVSLILAASALFPQVDHPAPGRIGRVLLLVPLASLAGVPPSLGFWSRWMGYNVALEWEQPGMMLLALGCQVSVMVALLRTVDQRLRRYIDKENDLEAGVSHGSAFRPGYDLWVRVVQWGALGLLSLPLVLLGFWPPAALMGLQTTAALVAGVSEPSLSITALSPTADALTPWITLAGLLSSLGAILWLSGWLRLPQAELIPTRAAGRWHRTATRLYEVLDLAWAYRLGWNVFVGLNRLLAGLARALDGHYALAWVILLGFVIGLFMLGGELLP